MNIRTWYFLQFWLQFGIIVISMYFLSNLWIYLRKWELELKMMPHSR